MDFLNELNEQLKSAMKARDERALKTIRDLKARIKTKEIEKGEPLSEPEFVRIVQTAAKQRKEAIELYTQGNRPDLVDIEKAELEILNTYLPKMMTEEEMQILANKVVEATGATSMADIGKVMGPLMKEAAGKADGKRLQAIVREILGG
ncbi:MAG: GatB/YqeY domain-containing protein [Candidatus Marinimicrobia bacterium]|nr:GatB/YqeY domain-containing protein [Candidatus Neomarinimicrobiota bacterium]MCF7850564.1 GatB/YqeY domain-containing protein [Candidatus Neomarinimicrobiota bacterium]MCF7903702.1 GatB/YqeY domain-containing protein [Candidatus Neomarinimicrobiota bacterium]